MVMSDIKLFPAPDKVPYSKERTLLGATESLEEWCMVIGYNSEGNLEFNCSVADAPTQLWMIEKVRHLILSQ